MRKRMVTEFGMGTSLRRRDYTEACRRALTDALWHNSLNMAEAFDLPKEAMIIEAEVAVQDPDAVDVATLTQVFPYGQVQVTVRHGGLDVPKPGSDAVTVIANAAITVFFEMERA